MSDHTPTEAQVRSCYGNAAITGEGQDQRLAAFDRWLAEVKREAAEKAWNEGFTQGFYDELAGGDHDACETSAINPYRRKETDDDR